jgi:hypothetical protein
MAIEPTTIILGKEYDMECRQALFRVLHDLGAECVSEESGVAGSQDLTIMVFRLNDDELVMEAETYRGLSLTGETDLIRLIQSRLVDSL